MAEIDEVADVAEEGVEGEPGAEPAGEDASATATVTVTESEAVRELIVKAYPEVVPELIQGGTLEEMLASLPAAQAAYQRISGELQATAPVPIPAGGSPRSTEPDLAGMSPEQLIKMGIGKTGSR